MRSPLNVAVLALTLLAAGGVAACQGCHAPAPATDPPAASDRPTVRLYVASTIAGALEPCGCSKDQLGGVDHLAAYVAAQSSAAPASLFVGAGPMLFLDPKLRAGDATQDEWKADAIAGAFKALHLAGWAPGANDWAAGADRLAKYRDASGALLLAGNIPGLGGAVVREVGGVKVGLVGVSDPKDRAGGYPAGITPGSAVDAMKAGIAEVKRQGATILVGLAAMPRGQALRLADEIPDLHVLVVGKPVEAGEANDAPTGSACPAASATSRRASTRGSAARTSSRRTSPPARPTWTSSAPRRRSSRPSSRR
jgi:2',3'-cyclic-nucleotide 2'-phosphodiesterase (5'-nucleotidase family)